MDASLITRLREPEEKYNSLKKMYADGHLKIEIIVEAMQKNGNAIFLRPGLPAIVGDARQPLSPSQAHHTDLR